MDRFEGFHLSGQVQSVARLGFDGSSALGSHLVQRGNDVGSEVTFGSFAHQFHAGADSTSGIGNFLVSGSRAALFEIY